MHTPALEKLAERGVILDSYYTQPRCSPSRAALLTGLYPYRTGMQRGNISPYRPSGLATVFPLLPEMLKEEGYSTHLIGKWHLGYCHPDYLPTSRGFDTFFGQYGQMSDHYTRVHDENKHIGAGYDLRRGLEVSREGEGKYSTELWAEEAVNNIEDRANSSQPWFLQVAFSAPRAPYQAPEKWVSFYDNGDLSNKSQFDAQVVRKAMVSAVDEAVGNIIEALETTGQMENTVVIFTSDNGAGESEANLPFQGLRGSINEGALRVPALVSSPLMDHSNWGMRISSLAHVTDWTPTLLALAGADRGGEFDGIPLWPVLAENNTSSSRNSVILNIDTDDQSNSFQFSIRRDNWKLIWGQPVLRVHAAESLEKNFELYNVVDDPGETNNLAKSKTKLVGELKKILLSAADDMKPSFHPNRYSLGYPRYHNGILETGWCASNWWDILWAPSNGRSIVLDRLQRKR